MSLIKSIHKELNRVRDLLKEYEAIPEGVFGAITIKASIKNAEKSIEEDNVVEMLRAYEDLKKITG